MEGGASPGCCRSGRRPGAGAGVAGFRGFRDLGTRAGRPGQDTRSVASCGASQGRDGVCWERSRSAGCTTWAGVPAASGGSLAVGEGLGGGAPAGVEAGPEEGEAGRDLVPTPVAQPSSPRAGARGTPRPQRLAHEPRVCGAAYWESCKGSAMTPPGEPWAPRGPSGRRPLRPTPPARVWSPAGL